MLNRILPAVVTLILGSASAQAATFSYDFDFVFDAPGGTNPTYLQGVANTVRLTLDNGGSTNINQVFTLDQVVSAQLISLGGSATGLAAYAQIPNGDPANGALNNGVTSSDFISTDGTGAAMFDFDAQARGILAFGTFNTNYISLGISGSAGGLCEYGVRIENVGQGLFCNGSINGRTGTLATATTSTVPLPAGGALLLVGLAGLGIAARRKRKANQS